MRSRSSNVPYLHEVRFRQLQKNRVHDSEIDFFRFIAIAAKDVFDCYVHGSIGLIEVF